jgi:hypothetical protein
MIKIYIISIVNKRENLKKNKTKNIIEEKKKINEVRDYIVINDNIYSANTFT